MMPAFFATRGSPVEIGIHGDYARYGTPNPCPKVAIPWRSSRSSSSPASPTTTPCSFTMRKRTDGLDRCARRGSRAASLAAKGWRLTHLLNTHHHGDHTGGNLALKEETGCTIIGPVAKRRAFRASTGRGRRRHIAFGAFQVQVLDTPGHTVGHVAYWIPSRRRRLRGRYAVCLGAARLRGQRRDDVELAEEAHGAAARHGDLLRARVHLANARFALTVDPENAALQKRAAEVDAARQGKADAADAARPGARDQPVPAAAGDRDPAPSGLPAARLEGRLPRSASARTS